jgi:hypothetical protein
MTDKDEILKFADERTAECRIERRAFEIWLATLTPGNWLTILTPALLSVFAGAAILGRPELLGNQADLYAGIAALLAGLLSTAHKALNCDTHQAECNRLARAYRSLETGYENLRISGDADLMMKVERLNSRLEQLRDSAGARAPDKCVAKARSEAIAAAT